MNFPFKSLGLVAVVGLSHVAEAAAHNPTGRRLAGTIESVDPSTKHLTFRADRDERTKTFVWNKRTQFAREISFIASSALRKGARANLTYHAPFFGEPFVSRVILLENAPVVRSRRGSS